MRRRRLIAGLLTVVIFGGGCRTLSKDGKVASSPVFSELRISSTPDENEEEILMRPGDEIVIHFAQLGKPEVTLTNTIWEDGTVTLLSNRVFRAAGKAIREFEREVYKSYGLNSYRIGGTEPEKP